MKQTLTNAVLLSLLACSSAWAEPPAEDILATLALPMHEGEARFLRKEGSNLALTMRESIIPLSFFLLCDPLPLDLPSCVFVSFVLFVVPSVFQRDASVCR